MNKINLLRGLLLLFSGILFFQGVPSFFRFMDGSGFGGIPAGFIVAGMFLSLLDTIFAILCLTFAWHAREYLQKWPLAFKAVAVSFPFLTFLSIVLMFVNAFSAGVEVTAMGMTFLVYTAVFLVIGSAMVNLVSSARRSVDGEAAVASRL